MTDVRVGDRVRVTIEGPVRIEGRDYFEVENAGARRSFLKSASTVEVIEKRPVQVGDTIEGIEAFQALPVGACVTQAGHSSTMMRTKDGFASTNGHVFTRPQDVYFARKLVFLP